MRTNKVIGVALLIGFIQLSCRGPEGPAGPTGPRGGGGVESLTDPSIQPKVLYTFPPPGSAGPYDGPPGEYVQLQVRFNKIMDRASLRRAFTLSSPHTRARIDTNEIFSEGDDLWTMYVADTNVDYYIFRWRVGETYTLGVSASAKDINGNLLLPAYSTTFMPEPHFRIKSIFPQNGSTDVGIGSSLSISFNGQVDTSAFSRIRITPPLHGRWEYGGYFPNDSSLIYLEGSPLSLNTVYTITVDASVHDQFGHPLQEGLASTFTTTPFRVYFTFPANGRTGVSPGELIQVSLTSAIDTGTVRSAFSITPNVPGQLYVNVRDLEFKASPQLAPEASYTITIDSSLRGAYGERLASPYRFSFTTAPFRVTDTQPGDGSDFVYRGLTIGVYCNAMIDSTTSRSSFTLRDSTGAVVAGSVINPSYQTDYFYFSPTGLFLPRMTYTATVSTSLKMLGGAPLSAPYTFVFKTAQ